MTVYKEAGRPLPSFSDDDVLDFVVTEAVILKNMEHRSEQQEQAKANNARAQFKQGKPGDPLPEGLTKG